MFEKMKDIWYDVSDFLITLIIVVLIIGAIALIMTNTLGVDFALSDYLSFLRDEPAPSVSVTEPQPTPSPTTPPIQQSPASTVTTPAEPTPAEADPSTPTPSESNIQPTNPDTPISPPTTASNEVVISVNEGDYLVDIANKLLDANIITSSEEFINLVVDRGLETNLQIGDFTFEENMTNEEALNVLFP